MISFSYFVLQTAVGATYFKTRKDANARGQKNGTEQQTMTCRRHGRLREVS